MSIGRLIATLQKQGIKIQLLDDNLKISAPGEKLTQALLAEIKENKAEIIALFKKHARKQEGFAAIGRAEKKEYYPLSSAQDRFYILQRVTPESTAYNMSLIEQIVGKVEKEKFEIALKKLIRRHESLRTSFLLIDGHPKQRIHDPRDMEFEIEYHEINSSRDAPAIIEQFIHSFDLSRPPLLRLSLIKLAEAKHILMLDIHHILSDGTSMSVFLKEFMILYRGGELGPLTLQYRDFAQWQCDRLSSGKLKKQENYWLEMFAGELPVLNMPCDFTRPPVQSFAGDLFEFFLEKPLASGLNRLINETGTTLNIMLLAVYNILLSRYTGQEDIVIGTTIAGRHHADLENIIGLLIETLALRNFPRAEMTFARFLQEVRQTTLTAYENQAYPFRELIKEVGAENEISRNPVFDAMLIVQNFEQTDFELEGLRFTSFELPGQEVKHMAKVDFTIEAMEVADEIHCSLEYCTALYKRETMERFMRHFTNIIKQVVEEPGIKLSDIAVTDEEERKQLLVTFNDNTQAVETGAGTLLPLRFADQVNKSPHHIAVVGMGQNVGAVHLSYSQLNIEAGKLARILVAKGIRRNTIAAVLLEPSIEMIISLYGILESGGAYLPIEPGYPAQRISYMLSDSGAQVLVTNCSLQGKVEKFRGLEVEKIFIEEGRGEAFPFLSSSECFAPTCIAYIIYTSGTTGRPKGVPVEHRNLSAYIAAFENEFDLTPDDTVVQQVSYAFDACVEELYPILVRGGKLAVPGKEVKKDIRALCEFIAALRVTLITCSPQLLNELDNYAADLAKGSPNLLSSLRILISGGDRLKAGYITNLLNIGEVYNTYGPTESTVCAAYYRCDKDKGLPGDVPIGKPIYGYRGYILDKYGSLLPIGVPGELCVAGPAVTPGYLNRPELTAEKFIASGGSEPFCKKVPTPPKTFVNNKSFSGGPGGRFYKKAPLVAEGDKIYKTGDLARWLPDGNIEFLGRIDRQVKIRGFRIELAGIENCLTALDNIKEAVVLERERKSGQNYLAAYVVSEAEDIEPSEVKNYLSRQLPDYMIPPYIMAVGEIPVTPSGKVDRGRLPHPDAPAGRVYAVPGSKNEKVLAGIWQDILELERVGLDDNFFDIGGTSLDIFKVNSRINEEFEKQVPMVSMFQYTTVRSLARFLETAGEQQGIPEEKQLQLTAAIAKGKEIMRKNIHKKGSATPTAKGHGSSVPDRNHEKVCFFNKPSQGISKKKPGMRTEAIEPGQKIAAADGIETSAAAGKAADIHSTGLEIAVIGMAGIFPGSGNLDEYWDNLKNGIEGIAFFNSEELEAAGIDKETLDNPNYIRARGIVAAAEYFDNSFFGFTPMEAQIMDPQIRVFTQCAWHALEDAGYDPNSYNQRIGLYAGASPNLQWEVITTLSGFNRGLSGFMTAQLTDKDFMCTHISYKLNLKGPSYSVQTACSTSLVAVHMAVQGLLHGECEMALTGGVSINYPPVRGYVYQEGLIFSDDGHNRTFDAAAKGSVFGDGVGAVVLKPLTEALVDKDNIYAVIKGSAANNDGIRKVGYTAPSIEGQAEVIKAALLMAEVEPETITYLEAHGTATPLGDSVEIEALKKAFNTGKKGFCAIGTVKSNVGHLYSAAGIAGLIKTALALKNRLIPPSLHFKNTHPQIDFENSPFYVVTKLEEWRPPCRAGVSSFGIGGTNAHVILKEPPLQVKGSGPEKSREQKLLLLSAKTGYALNQLTDDFINYLLEHPRLDFADTAYTLQVGRKHFPYRRMVVTPALDLEQDAEKLSLLARRTQIVLSREAKRPVFFLICGQGSQYVNMGIDLYRSEAVFRMEIDRCFEILKPLMGYDLKEILYPASPQKTFIREGGEKQDRPDQQGILDQQKYSRLLNKTEITQPVLFAFEYALAKLLMSWGIKPAAMIGYSFGEYVAACLAGVFSLKDALELVITRGQLTRETPPGAMVSVPLPEKDLKPLLKGDLALAIVNGPTCIVSGPQEPVDTFVREMKEKRVMCVPVNMSYAIHSRVMSSIRRKYENKIKDFTLNKPGIPYISNVTARWIKEEEATDSRYWGDHLCSTVRFSDGLKTLLKEENAIFIEIGPGRILGMMVRVHPDKKPGHMILNTVKHPQEKVSDDYFLLDKLGQLWLHGQEIDWAGFYGEEKRCRISLPAYPFTGKRYWIDPGVLKSSEGIPSLSQTLMSSPTVEPLREEPGPAPGVEETSREYAVPRNKIEEAIARLWQEQMGIDKIGIHDDFFYLNGSSLVATHIMARLQETYNIEIPIERFFEEPTIAHLAEVIKEECGP